MADSEVQESNTNGIRYKLQDILFVKESAVMKLNEYQDQIVCNAFLTAIVKDLYRKQQITLPTLSKLMNEIQKEDLKKEGAA
jgi:hypothetical protein